MTYMSPILVSALIAQQSALGLNDTKFAIKLGIARTVWVQAKQVQRPIGLTLLRAVARTYPDLNEEILAFLRDGDGN